MAKANNTNLNSAKREKNDEFYTLLEDIENELKYYKDHFKGKVVYCNCDNVTKDQCSNFFKYFALNYEFLGLKGLVCTAYNPNGNGKKYEYFGDLNGNNYPDEEEIETTEMEGNGDFRSQECIEILKKADVVVTNPPFSLFREYVAQLMEYDKKFLIIGNMNAIIYKEIFPLIKGNKIWWGVSLNGTKCSFKVTEDYEGKNVYYNENGIKLGKVNNAIWLTNLDHKKRHEEMTLYKKYNAEDYPKYDNYDAIEVGRVTDIPCDYDGIMGVPISFLSKYNPRQFEIVGEMVTTKITEFNYGYPYINGKKKYARILIKRISIR